MDGDLGRESAYQLKRVVGIAYQASVAQVDLMRHLVIILLGLSAFGRAFRSGERPLFDRPGLPRGRPCEALGNLYDRIAQRMARREWHDLLEWLVSQGASHLFCLVLAPW